MKIWQLKCRLDKKSVNALIDDLFIDCYLYGHGSYSRRQNRTGHGNNLRFSWAETRRGRKLWLRQLEDGLWLFHAIFPGGSERFAGDRGLAL